jgi:hypothetical protein
VRKKASKYLSKKLRFQNRAFSPKNPLSSTIMDSLAPRAKTSVPPSRPTGYANQDADPSRPSHPPASPTCPPRQDSGFILKGDLQVARLGIRTSPGFKLGVLVSLRRFEYHPRRARRPSGSANRSKSVSWPDFCFPTILGRFYGGRLAVPDGWPEPCGSFTCYCCCHCCHSPEQGLPLPDCRSQAAVDRNRRG